MTIDKFYERSEPTNSMDFAISNFVKGSKPCCVAAFKYHVLLDNVLQNPQLAVVSLGGMQAFCVEVYWGKTDHGFHLEPLLSNCKQAVLSYNSSLVDLWNLKYFVLTIGVPSLRMFEPPSHFKCIFVFALRYIKLIKWFTLARFSFSQYFPEVLYNFVFHI